MTLDGRPGKPWEEGEERINQVVFIGRNLDDIEIKSGFNSCTI
jgi:G3E family GTPase